MRIKLKILASFAMPILVASFLGGLLAETHHTSLPPLTPPPSGQPLRPEVLQASRCDQEISKPFAGVAVTKVSSNTVHEFTAATKSEVSIIEFYSSFPSVFNRGGALNAVKLNDIPLLQLDPGKLNKYALRRIASGKDNAKIAAYAESVKEFGYCIIISFGHEMNGWWYHWGARWNTPATFINAWRNVHDIFRQVGADNVIWSWDPSHQYTQVTPGRTASPASEWYPGSKYVDWIGLDGYLGSDYNGAPQNFDEIFGPQLAYIRQVAPHKLVYLAETAVAPSSTAAQQIGQLFAGIRRDNMQGLIWFDEKQKNDWRITPGRPAEIAAYARGVKTYPAKKIIDALQR